MYFDPSYLQSSTLLPGLPTTCGLQISCPLFVSDSQVPVYNTHMLMGVGHPLELGWPTTGGHAL